MKALNIVFVLLALVGCQSQAERAREAEVQAAAQANVRLTTDVAACRSTYPIERNTIMSRMRCLIDASNAYPYHKYPDLVAVFNAERLIAAERFRDGKTSEAELTLEVANAQNKATSIHHSRDNANRPPPPMMHMILPPLVTPAR